MQNEKIGWIGLGNMGIPMVENLLKARCWVTVYNRTIYKTKPLVEKGAKVAPCIADLVENSDIIFLMISDDAAVESVFAEILPYKTEGKLFVNASTVSPETSKKFAKMVREKGGGYLDAPVSGSVKPAQDAALVILVGGAEKDFGRACPFLEKLGKTVFHLGENGAGSAAKLAINYFLALTVQGFAETVLFAEDNGISRGKMMEIINASACGSAITAMKTPLVLKNEFPAAFALKLMAKDLRLVQTQKINYPLSKPVIETYQSALQKGLGEKDMAAVIETLRE